jgi:hypothetical protein
LDAAAAVALAAYALTVKSVARRKVKRARLITEERERASLRLK